MKTPPPPEYAQVEHVVLPVHLPDLSSIQNADIKALRSRIQTEGRKARAEASKAIYKEDILRKPWMTSLGNGSDEDKAEARRVFEQEILRYPDAFLRHAWANALSSLDNALLGEMIRRSHL